MGWLTLQSRKLNLVSQINEAELQDLTLSREIRKGHRTLSYEQAVQNSFKTQELRQAKAKFDFVKDLRPSAGEGTYEQWRNEYAQWEVEYARAKEEYEADKLEIENYYDDINQQLEEEATDKETRIQEEQATIEANLEAWRSELESINETIKTDIEAQKISLS